LRLVFLYLMPELPEVETIVRALRDGGRGGLPILGRVVASAHLFWEGCLAEPGPADFLERISGQTVTTLERRAKYLVIRLNPDTLLVHLRMSGDLRVEAQGTPDLPHDRLALDFVDGLRLVFNDPRKFGRVWLVQDPQTILGRLGPEPFAPEMTPESFHALLQRSRRQIKPLLLDQSFIAGLGNIYTDEALHLSAIHPLTPSDQLTGEEGARLLAAIQMTLQEGIRRNGASFDWVYRGGDFQNSFRVYRRTGEACPVCGTAVERMVVGQRGTHFCPVCQPMRLKS
jgi:formamidopyrimidine-DNA glycosylase